MKTTFKFILVALSVTFFSCQKDENLSTGSSSITNAGVLSGTIVNYTPNSIDSVRVWDTENYIGMNKASMTGDFSIDLAVPHLSKFGAMKGVFVSDTTAMTGTVSIYSYLNNNSNGVLLKCNYTTDSFNIVGMAYSFFIYSDKNLTIKGTLVNKYAWDSGTKTSSFTYIYNVNIKKGWNELVIKLNSFTSSQYSLTRSESITNTITSDLQWHLLNLDYYDILTNSPEKKK